MENKGKHYIAIFAVLLVLLLAACESSAGVSNDESEKQQNNDSSQDAEHESSGADSAEDDTNTGSTNTDDTASEKEEDPPANETEDSLKEEYLQKLNNSKKEADALEAADSSTYALKKVENDRWEIWDERLNEIYGVLQERLPAEEMESLREEQRDWLKERDARALEASLKYEGGTQEHLEYVAVLADLTEERCYELVENYMNEAK
ncbi:MULTISPECIES: lysozyme inhibitor LprI family protein [Bacillaceae]|uniref:lysozyme inhibitor LprI family protein n=2 Tax=Bacillales TaxID=1385 RepID=UPI00209EB7F2|nr:lysozyme inhibitor LprI family protein [Bacillus infantis]MCP1160985.1 DUF1311 domain-containing protein [Bacillus infantis]MDW2876155.1 lysozyme inhibitor LprI family protein [Bacillus infantis]